MSKAVKIWLIVAASLVLLGIIIFGGVMMFLNWNFGSFATNDLQTNTYEISEDFNNISFDTSTADIAFLASDDEKCKIVCYEEERLKHSVGVSNGTLTINEIDNRKWYNYISIVSKNPMITVYLPKTEFSSLSGRVTTGDVGIPNDFKFESIELYGNTSDVNCYASATGLVKIKRSTGQVRVENISAGALDISVSTGKIFISNVACDGKIELETDTGDVNMGNVTCKHLSVDGETSDIILEKVIVEKNISIEADTGDIRFDKCDASELFIETDTGDVTGTLLSEKIFLTKSDTGKINVPSSVAGGRCEISTDTGDIKISIVGE